MQPEVMLSSKGRNVPTVVQNIGNLFDIPRQLLHNHFNQYRVAILPQQARKHTQIQSLRGEGLRP
jgi:hypothetical protein